MEDGRKGRLGIDCEKSYKNSITSVPIVYLLVTQDQVQIQNLGERIENKVILK